MKSGGLFTLGIARWRRRGPPTLVRGTIACNSFFQRIAQLSKLWPFLQKDCKHQSSGLEIIRQACSRQDYEVQIQSTKRLQNSCLCMREGAPLNVVPSGSNTSRHARRSQPHAQFVTDTPLRLLLQPTIMRQAILCMCPS